MNSFALSSNQNFFWSPELKLKDDPGQYSHITAFLKHKKKKKQQQKAQLQSKPHLHTPQKLLFSMPIQEHKLSKDWIPALHKRPLSPSECLSSLPALNNRALARNKTALSQLQQHA